MSLLSSQSPKFHTNTRITHATMARLEPWLRAQQEAARAAGLPVPAQNALVNDLILRGLEAAQK